MAREIGVNRAMAKVGPDGEAHGGRHQPVTAAVIKACCPRIRIVVAAKASTAINMLRKIVIVTLVGN
ncbi:MAG: hypothetical protein B7Y47_10525 [Sphingomonas sp. 28-63-12]|nr:MAG: hypothetical protein B7Y47_10525 [Sphingomonas sp. 28-63-12]